MCLLGMHDPSMTKHIGVAAYAALGGKTRAEQMTKEQRSESARLAAAARWGTGPVLRATHSGELKVGNLVIPCAVLEDGTRVLTQWGFYRAIGRSGRPAAGRGSSIEKVAPFLALDNLKPYVSRELADSTKPIGFRLRSGKFAYGYRADLLPKVCEVYLKARDDNKLLKSQNKFAMACDLLMRGLAHVGLIALVDEATGFQDARARDALAKLLEAFVAKELRKWVRTFPVDYFKELCRLRRVPFPTDKFRLPSYFGHLTNDIVYDRLAPGVRAELKRLTPRNEKGRLKNKLFQLLTDDVGHPKLREHLASTVALMRASDDWNGFLTLLNRALPKHRNLPLFDSHDYRMPAESSAPHHGL